MHVRGSIVRDHSGVVLSRWPDDASVQEKGDVDPAVDPEMGSDRNRRGGSAFYRDEEYTGVAVFDPGAVSSGTLICGIDW